MPSPGTGPSRPYLLTMAAAVAALVGFLAFGFRGVVKRGSRRTRDPRGKDKR